MKDNKPLPKYMQLKQEILSWLHSGLLKTGDQMPTENEIAERYGMSRQTVRQTFGELEQEGLLERVQGKGTFVSSPQEQGAAAGRGLQESQTIGIITTYISDYIFPHIVRGAEAVLRERGYRLVLSSTDNDKTREQESLKLLMSEPLSGLIIEPTRSAEGNPNLSYFLSLDYESVPYLMINEKYAELDCPCVKVNDEAGGYKAAEHLIQLGHRRIAGFFKMDDLQGVRRLKGFMRAHHDMEVPLQPVRVIHYTTEEKQVKPFEAALAMLKLSPAERPTAFVCYNDELAVHLLEAVRQAGLSVPHDVSVVGFDDSTLAVATGIKLTTLSHPKNELGEAAAEMLLGMIEGGHRPDGGKLFEPELIVRESTRQL